jgi:L-threonylcarbamoyladenylate synthase
METVRIQTAADISRAVQRAAEVLRQGGIILYPTDTIYGLGADALSDEAVQKIYKIKGRDEGKPIHALVDSIRTAETFADLGIYKNKVGSLVSNPISWIAKKNEDVLSGIAKTIDTFGFRVPNNEFCLELTRAFGGPITATSANKAGEPTLNTLEEILAQLELAAELIDLVIDAGTLPPSLPSTVIDISGAEPKVLRQGAWTGDF